MHFALPRGSCGVGCGSVRPCYGKHARRGCYCYEVTLATISWTLEILSVLSAMLTVLLMAVIVIYAAACTALNLTADDFAAINKQINDAIDGPAILEEERDSADLYDAICSDDSPSLKSIAVDAALMVGGSSLKLVGHDVVRACFLASWAEHDKVRGGG
mmetsp:Transcript_12509/g.41121  ORF Transcript_12509/g.41121 Transcript_12509/m.41121 type:complete len:159 (+) Transcript_12509:2-478(+)